MSEPALRHRHDADPAWHRPLNLDSTWARGVRPVVSFRLGVSRGTCWANLVALTPSLGEQPNPWVLVDAVWRPQSQSAWDLMLALQGGVNRWMEGFGVTGT